METIERPDLAADADLHDQRRTLGAPRRARRRDRRVDVTRTRDEALRVLDAADVPSGPIYTAADIVADEQYLARDMVQQLPVDVGGETVEVAFPGIVPLLGERSVPVSSPGPDLGADTHGVVVDLLGRTSCPCRGCSPVDSGER